MSHCTSNGKGAGKPSFTQQLYTTKEQHWPDEKHTKNQTALASYRKRITSYLRCHQQAWQHDKEYRVLPRLQVKYEGVQASSDTRIWNDNPVASRQDSNAPTTTMTTTNVWTSCLPRLLLMILLNVACHEIIQAKPTYKELMAELVAQRRDNQNLAFEYDKMVDDFAHFQRELGIIEEQLAAVGTASQIAPAQSTRPSTTPSNHGVAATPLRYQSGERLKTPAVSFNTDSHTPSHHKRANSTTSSISTLSTKSPQRTLLSPQEDRVVSPTAGMIPRLQQLPTPSKNPPPDHSMDTSIHHQVPTPLETTSHDGSETITFPTPPRTKKPTAKPIRPSTNEDNLWASSESDSYNESQSPILSRNRNRILKKAKKPQQEKRTNNKPKATKHMETRKAESSWISKDGWTETRKRGRDNATIASASHKALVARGGTGKKRQRQPG